MITSGSAVAGTAVTPGSLFRTPPGPATLLLANVGTVSTVFVGPGTVVTASNGFPVPSGAVSPVVVPVYAGCQNVVWSAVTSGGTGVLAWIVSDPSAGTGP